MEKYTDGQLQSALNQLDSQVRTQRGRMGLMQGWLDLHARKLDSLEASMDAHLARLDALLGGRRVGM